MEITSSKECLQKRTSNFVDIKDVSNYLSLTLGL